MVQSRRRGGNYRCPLRAALPAAALLLFLLAAVALLYVSPPPLSDHPVVASSRRRRSPHALLNSSGGGGMEESERREISRAPTNGSTVRDDLWGSKLASKFYGCSNSSSKFLDSNITTQPDRYLMIVTSGGLNQQRTGIIDAVVAARILNATLVVPKLDQTSFWKDSSNFSDIFDTNWFISSLSKDVKIVKELPHIGGKLWAPHRMRVPRKCTERCYLNRVLPALLKKHDFIFFMTKSKSYKYLFPVHLNPEKGRRQGRCPLTPEEVGLMLRALGYRKDVHIYVASGEIYGGARTLSPLKALFPNLHTKETISSKEELAPFSKYSSRMAALDFIVCDESDAFVANNNGNMAKILAGRRRYFGHKRTIRPNAKRLYPLFLNRGNMSWDAFSSKVHMVQKGFMGEPKELRPGRGEFHENPSTCICERTDGKAVARAKSQDDQVLNSGADRGKGIGEPAVPNHTDEEVGEPDDDEDAPAEREIVDAEMDDNVLVGPEDPELEQILSD
ncbi:unnamed protein product [Miscanthus lutarioriparius]|uniref:O-fucosyltransferase family protein n=1 Tax=Miscanthus lutarioriparius TaxID=422564 RepID=A0A811R4P3_9POAL|nr:unnamed protein product [Miscanthus lutarioriparius]